MSTFDCLKNKAKMEIHPLISVSPIDGRYHSKTKELNNFFSEFALFKYRTQVEIEYFISLCEIPLPRLEDFDDANFNKLRAIYDTFSLNDAKRIKTIEATTNHDIKAVEYFIKERFDTLGLSEYKEYIHFGLTSQDINNTAIPVSVKDALERDVVPSLNALTKQIYDLASDWKEISMLSRTHGQPASPTKLGKEFFVFVERLNTQLNMLDQLPISGKFGGATGNFNAHTIAYPNINWVEFANEFLSKKLGIKRQQTTTQIEHYDEFAALCDNFKRINNILIDLCRDVWTYVSMDYFKQRIVEGEVGSSAMPHKVNPIDFENAEGNLGIANALFEHLAAKLPISRLQRDLTDSTVLRNIGVPFGHMLISIKSLQKGFGKLLLSEQALADDLENNWAVVAEAVQTILRREGVENPYEKLKDLTRKNERITKKSIQDFISNLDVNDAIKKELAAITPFNYTGNA